MHGQAKINEISQVKYVRVGKYFGTNLVELGFNGTIRQIEFN